MYNYRYRLFLYSYKVVWKSKKKLIAQGRVVFHFALVLLNIHLTYIWDNIKISKQNACSDFVNHCDSGLTAVWRINHMNSLAFVELVATD